jgi:hypothetical protein
VGCHWTPSYIRSCQVLVNALTGKVGPGTNYYNKIAFGKHQVEDYMYSVTILGNVEQCRTEAEISDSEGTLLAVVYQTSVGWHTDVLVEQLNQTATDFQTAVENAKQSLSHYVNRRGENPPENATRGAFSLWLMVKDDGTAMGVNMKSGPKSW